MVVGALDAVTIIMIALQSKFCSPAMYTVNKKELSKSKLLLTFIYQYFNTMWYDRVSPIRISSVAATFNIINFPAILAGHHNFFMTLTVRLSLGPSGGFSFKFTKFQICNSRRLQSFSKWDSECRNSSLISYNLFMQSPQLPLTSSRN